MIAYIVASHGDFAKSIVKSSWEIFGKQEKVVSVALEPDEDPKKLLTNYQTTLKGFDQDDQVIFLVDLFGGTPFNVAGQIVAEHPDRMALLTGLNLAMLSEAYVVRDQSLKDAVLRLEESAKSGVRHLELPEEDKGDD
ncbi:PTS system, mannose-specific IIB component [Pediococcus damnosus]|uniref:PTS system, mannose-specific IIB component n=1 Tax=Pediococcus damnosus TaxID=51663 RepID=A0A0R2HJN6_9LACO|nr:PTS sugar transporter subunit IIA [Pediococcus damnosus]AMV62650.1 PTS system, mannose-specific IIB component [Pediococcus damnosus]AMV67468.1 PTS system, mannose-specific IIB component [Pediococcus damnosus]KRN50565.1 mannose PTS, EIIA [Pediococcus damnosus]PJE49529.1 PTS mannose transporter subunit IIA [Pediococcus damnosus]